MGILYIARYGLGACPKKEKRLRKIRSLLAPFDRVFDVRIYEGSALGNKRFPQV